MKNLFLLICIYSFAQSFIVAKCAFDYGNYSTCTYGGDGYCTKHQSYMAKPSTTSNRSTSPSQTSTTVQRGIPGSQSSTSNISAIVQQSQADFEEQQRRTREQNQRHQQNMSQIYTQQQETLRESAQILQESISKNIINRGDSAGRGCVHCQGKGCSACGRTSSSECGHCGGYNCPGNRCTANERAFSNPTYPSPTYPSANSNRAAEIARLEQEARQRVLADEERRKLEALKELERREREAFESGGLLGPGALDGLSNLGASGSDPYQLALLPNGINVGQPDPIPAEMTDQEFADYVAKRLGVDQWGQAKGDKPYIYKNNAWPAGGPPVSSQEVKWVFESQAEYQARFNDMVDQRIIPPGYKYVPGRMDPDTGFWTSGTIKEASGKESNLDYLPPNTGPEAYRDYSYDNADASDSVNSFSQFLKNTHRDEGGIAGADVTRQIERLDAFSKSQGRPLSRTMLKALEGTVVNERLGEDAPKLNDAVDPDQYREALEYMKQSQPTGLANVSE